jgi:hypothetical protein
MDSDDISLPQRLSKQVAFMEEHEEIGISGTWIEMFGNVKHKLKYPLSSDEIKVCLFWGTAFAHPSVIMRREAIQKYNLRYREEFLHAEDYGFWVEAAQYFEMGNIPEFLLKYRVTSGNVSNKYATIQANTAFNITLKNIKSLGVDIEPAFRELLQNKVFTAGKLDSIAEIRKIEAFLVQLKELNCQRKMYPEDAFNRSLNDKLYRVCVKSVKLGSEVINIFRNASLGGFKPISLEQAVRLFVKAYF